MANLTVYYYYTKIIVIINISNLTSASSFTKCTVIVLFSLIKKNTELVPSKGCLYPMGRNRSLVLVGNLSRDGV